VICHFSLTPVEGAGINVPYWSSHKTWHAVHYHLSPCQCMSPLLSSPVPLYLKTKRAHLTPFMMGSHIHAMDLLLDDPGKKKVDKIK